MKTKGQLLGTLLGVAIILVGIAGILLTIRGYETAGDICGGVFWLGLGSFLWADSKTIAIMVYVSAGLDFLSAILSVLHPAG